MKSGSIHEGEKAEYLKELFSLRLQTLLNEKIQSEVYQFLVTHAGKKKHSRDGAIALNSPFLQLQNDRAAYNETKVYKPDVAGKLIRRANFR